VQRRVRQGIHMSRHADAIIVVCPPKMHGPGYVISGAPSSGTLFFTLKKDAGRFTQRLNRPLSQASSYSS
jgi:hypothetical protein